MRRTRSQFSLPSRKERFDPFRRAVLIVLLAAAGIVAVLFYLDARAVARQEEAINDRQFLLATLARLAAEDRFSSVDVSARFLLNHVFPGLLSGDLSPAEAQKYLQPMVYNMPEVLGFYFLPADPGEDRTPVPAFRSTPAGNEGRAFAEETASRLGPGPLSPEEAGALSGTVKATSRWQMALFSDGLLSQGTLRGVLFTVVDLSPLLSRYVLPLATGRNAISLVLSEDGSLVWFGGSSSNGQEEGIFREDSPELESIRRIVSGAVSGKSSLDLPGGGTGKRLLVAWNTLRMGGKRLSVVSASPGDEVDAALRDLRTQRNLLVGALVLLVVLGGVFFTGKQRQEEILRRESTLRAVFNKASSGIAILGEEGAFLSCNAAWEAMTGLSQERLRQKTIFDLVAPGPGQGREELRQALPEKNGRAEVRFLRADGLTFWGDVSLAVLEAAPAFPAGSLLALITDISGMKRAEDLLRQSAAALEAQKAELEKLASDQRMLLDLFTLFAEADTPAEIHRALFASLPAIITFRNLFLCIRDCHEPRYTTLDALGEMERTGQADFCTEGKGIVGHVFRTGKPYIAGDLAMDPWYVPHSDEARSLVAVPVSYKGKDWGVLCLDSAAKYAFGVRERDLLALVGFYVALHLEELEARTELDRKAGQLGFLHRVVREMAAERTNGELSGKIVGILGSELGFPTVGIFVPGEKEGENPVLLAGYSGGAGEDDVLLCLSDDAGEALRTGMSVEREGDEGSATLAVPMSFNGQVFAVLAACNERGFSSSEKEILEITAEHGATFWVLNNLMAERRREALIDPLTQVWNRRYIMRRLEEESSRIARSGGRGAVVLVDLGDFKSINDRFGHVAGDEVLKETASLMSANLRTCDMIGRYGGDEFLLYLPDVTVDQAAAAVRRMEERAAALKIPGVVASVVLDYGIASCPGDGDDLVAVIGTADARMYENKTRRKAGTA